MDLVTRLGYAKNEVVLSLLTSLLLKTDLKESYYWLYELYYSDIDVFPLLWKIYFDFYYVLNPRLEEYIEKKHTLWESTKDMKYVAYVLRNMYRCKPNSDIFILRQFSLSFADAYADADADADAARAEEQEEQEQEQEEQEEDWIYAYPLQYHNLLLAIKTCHYEKICYYLNQLLKSEDIYSSAEYINYLLQKYFNIQEKLLAAEMYDGYDFHYLLSLIVHNMNLCENMFASLNISAGNIFLAPKDADLLKIIETNVNKLRLYEINVYEINVYEIDPGLKLKSWCKDAASISIKNCLPSNDNDFISFY